MALYAGTEESEPIDIPFHRKRKERTIKCKIVNFLHFVIRASIIERGQGIHAHG